MIRIVVADDQQLVREGFRMILDAQDDLEVVGEAADGEQALQVVAESAPDVVLMDIRMPRLDGLAATRRLVVEQPRCRVLVLTTFDLDDYVFEALQAGASGFLLKDVGRDDLVRAVRVVAAGDAMLAPAVTRRLIESFTSLRERSSPVPPPAALDALTPRELDTLRLVARGLSNAEAAAELFVSEHTVKTHVSNVLMKLALRDRVQAVVLAYECGLVRPSG